MSKINANKLVGTEVERKATIDKNNINTEERRVSILISTENPIRRYDFWSDSEYDEVLLHGEDNVDLTRAESGVLRYMHGNGKYGELPIGRLENVRIENKELRADAVFSKANPDAEMLWRMVEEGTLTNISVGGIKRQVRITERENNVPLVEVTRWEFLEASLVDIGADAYAGVNRKQENNIYEGEAMKEKVEELKREIEAMKENGAKTEEIVKKVDELNRAIEELAKENAELKRQSQIKDLLNRHQGVLSDEKIEEIMRDTSITEKDVGIMILNAKEEKEKHVVSVASKTDNADFVRAVTDAMLIRSNVKVEEPHKDTNMFAQASLLDIMKRAVGYSGFDINTIIQRAMSTSDFPILLGEVANKILANTFQEARATFHSWTDATDLPNFLKREEVSRTKIPGRLSKTAEWEQVKSKAVSETGEVWGLDTYTGEIELSRKMIINDELNAFANTIDDFALLAKRTANGLVYDLLQSKGDYTNYKMGDGKPIFDATAHKNIASSGAKLTIDALTTARTAMRRQTGPGGIPLDVTPKFLIVAPENETKAKRIVYSPTDVSQDNPDVINPFKNSFEIVIDPELDPKPWYLAAQRKTIKVGYLRGSNRMPQIMETRRDLRGVIYQCVFDFGLFAEDFRGLYKNPGA